jgi:hypothetical protein
LNPAAAVHVIRAMADGNRLPDVLTGIVDNALLPLLTTAAP